MKSKKRFTFNFFLLSHVPKVAYISIFLAALLLWWYSTINQDFALDLLSELIGIAFLMLILDVLLVKSKTKRWKIVRDDVDYLISRNVNRLRDGICTRFFSFQPEIKLEDDDRLTEDSIRQQRGIFLDKLANTEIPKLTNMLNAQEAFSETSYEYLNEKANDIWDIINMKYSEYLEPELVSLLIQLHTQIKDACSHIRQYRKSERFVNDKEHYMDTGLLGLSKCLSKIITILNTLKEEGYSRQAIMFEDEAAN